jgi:hypothetical protein
MFLVADLQPVIERTKIQSSTVVRRDTKLEDANGVKRWWRMESVMSDLSEIADLWAKNANQATFAHRFGSKYWNSANLFLGIPLIIVTVGTGILAGAALYENSAVISLAGLFLSFVAAVLAGVQTFLRPSERAIQHWQASTKYAAARRAIELINIPTPEARREFDVIRKELDALGENSPLVSERFHRRSIDRPK